MELHIGPLTIQLSGITENDIPVNSRLFLTSPPHKAKADFHYTFHFVDQLPVPQDGWPIAFRRNDIIVFRKGILEARLLAVGNITACYAFYQETSEQEATIYFMNALKGELQIDTLFVSCLCLERRLAQNECHIFHCAFLDYNGQSILFSGPSGIGKSTHAEFWCRNIAHTRIINGDRALLCPRIEGGYDVCGWPVCGSSGICFNEKRTLAAIVFMEQAAVNQVRSMTLIQQLKALSSQITINWWDADFTHKTLDRLTVLAENTYISTYACNMMPEAAHTLHLHLKEKGIIR